MADDGYIKFGDFFTEIKRICNSFIGKEIIDTSFISSEISIFYDSLDWRNHLPCINITPTAIIYDRTDNNIEGIDEYSANTGSITIISYKTKPSGEEDGIIQDIKVTNHISEFNDCYLTDISQILDYILAKKERKKIIAKNEKLKQQIQENDKKINTLEKIVKIPHTQGDVACNTYRNRYLKPTQPSRLGLPLALWFVRIQARCHLCSHNSTWKSFRVAAASGHLTGTAYGQAVKP